MNSWINVLVSLATFKISYNVLAEKQCAALSKVIMIGGIPHSSTISIKCTSSQHCCNGGCCDDFVLTWHFWLMIGLGLLIVVLFGVAYYIAKRNKRKNEEVRAKQINLFDFEKTLEGSYS